MTCYVCQNECKPLFMLDKSPVDVNEGGVPHSYLSVLLNCLKYFWIISYSSLPFRSPTQSYQHHCSLSAVLFNRLIQKDISFAPGSQGNWWEPGINDAQSRTPTGSAEGRVLCKVSKWTPNYWIFTVKKILWLKCIQNP